MQCNRKYCIAQNGIFFPRGRQAHVLFNRALEGLPTHIAKRPWVREGADPGVPRIRIWRSTHQDNADHPLPGSDIEPATVAEARRAARGACRVKVSHGSGACAKRLAWTPRRPGPIKKSLTKASCARPAPELRSLA